VPPTAAVDIELKANVQQLLKALSQVEDISEKQAKALVRDIEKSNAAMERASNKAAKAQKRSFDRAAKEAQARAEGMTDVAQKTATEIGSIFGIGILGDLEGTFDIARQSTEKFGGSMQANMAIGGAAVVAFAAAAVQALSALTSRQLEAAAAIAESVDEIRQFADAETVARVEEFAGHIEAIDAGVLIMQARAGLANDELLEMAEHAGVMKSIGLPEWMAWITEKHVDLLDAMPESLRKIVLLSDRIITGGWFAMGEDVASVGRAAREVGEAYKTVSDSNEEWADSVKDLAKEMDKQDQAARTQATKDQAAEVKRLTEFNRLWAGSTRDAEAAEKKRIDTAKALEKQIDAVATTQDKNIDIIDSEGAALRKLNRDYEAQVKAIGAVGLATGDAERMTQQLADASEAYRISLEAIDAKQAAAEFADISAKVSLAAHAVTELAGAASTFAGLALDRFSELADAERERFEARVERQTEAQREEVAAQLESGEISQTVADARLEALDLNEEHRKKYHKALTKDQRKAANRAFAVSQAAAVAGVLASGAQAYVALLASMSYLQFGAPAAAAAITGPAVAAQLAVIASNKPPQFADGGMVTPDHRMISAQPGEAVISRRGVAALGGPTGIDSLNRGMQSGQNVTANIVLDRRIIGQAVADLVPASMTRRRGRIAVYGG
jgi:hypothetical protein